MALSTLIMPRTCEDAFLQMAEVFHTETDWKEVIAELTVFAEKVRAHALICQRDDCHRPILEIITEMIESARSQMQTVTPLEFVTAVERAALSERIERVKNPQAKQHLQFVAYQMPYHRAMALIELLDTRAI